MKEREFLYTGGALTNVTSSAFLPPANQRNELVVIQQAPGDRLPTNAFKKRPSAQY